MSAFVDTSFLYAFLDARDPNHAEAVGLAVAHLEGAKTHAYVVVETLALVTQRASRASARRVALDVLPSLQVSAVSLELHDRSLATLLTAPARFSFVDLVSFEFARTEGISEVLAFDDDFEAAGFRLLHL